MFAQMFYAQQSFRESKFEVKSIQRPIYIFKTVQNKNKGL